METIALNDLEIQIKNLLTEMQHLRSDNNKLRNQLSVVNRERERLAEINQQATTTVKNIIQKLKEEVS